MVLTDLRLLIKCVLYPCSNVIDPGQLTLTLLRCPRPIYRAPLGHTLFYCQGALFPWPDKTCNQFPIKFFTISRRHHSKWFGRYINHISDHTLALKQTMNHPFIPESYPFLLPNSVLCILISVHKLN